MQRGGRLGFRVQGLRFRVLHGGFTITGALVGSLLEGKSYDLGSALIRGSLILVNPLLYMYILICKFAREILMYCLTTCFVGMLSGRHRNSRMYRIPEIPRILRIPEIFGF